jgi:hypothetical protein
MTKTEMIDQAWKAVQNNAISQSDYDALMLALTYKPPKVDYYDYIASPQWKVRADAAKARAFYRCQVCNRGRDEGARLDAHHRTYTRLGNERPEDITVLCHECHELFTFRDRAALLRQMRGVAEEMTR